MLIAALVVVAVSAQRGRSIESTTPVPILKQINRVNDDGSYTYGYEAADGTFKVETRDKEGNVRGKYGYLDETGILKTVEYAAGRGFEAQGAHLPEQPVVPLDGDWEEPTTIRPKKKKTNTIPVEVPAPLPVQQPVQQLAPVIPQQPARIQQNALPVPAIQTPPVQQNVFRPPQAPARAVNDLGVNAPKRGFSFSFEAPVFIPATTARPFF